MAEPLTAVYRVDLTITIAGLNHKQFTYCEASPSLIAASGYYLWNRSGVALIDFGDAVNAWWTALRSVYDSQVTAVASVLSNFSGGTWNPVAAHTVTLGTAPAGTAQGGGQLTISNRTDNFKRQRVILLETLVPVGKKYGSQAAFAAAYAAVAGAIDGSDSNVSGYFNWARSRNKKLLHPSTAIVSAVTDLNDRVRRARGLQ
jgi:hypothetical protein